MTLLDGACNEIIKHRHQHSQRATEKARRTAGLQRQKRFVMKSKAIAVAWQGSSPTKRDFCL